MISDHVTPTQRHSSMHVQRMHAKHRKSFHCYHSDLVLLAQCCSLATLLAGILWGHFCSSNIKTREGAFGLFLRTLKPTLVAHLNLKYVQSTTRHHCTYQLMPPSLVTICCAGEDVELIHSPSLLILFRYQIEHRGC